MQSALLEAMQERQVTIGLETHSLPDPFIVTATMNPLESDGTYALPLAQMDRFLVKMIVDYPSPAQELAILERFGSVAPVFERHVARMSDIIAWRSAAQSIFIEPKLSGYIVALVTATRQPHPYVERGASPRATLALAAMARAGALVDGRTFVTPDDVRGNAAAVLRHRLAFNYRLLTDGVRRRSDRYGVGFRGTGSITTLLGEKPDGFLALMRALPARRDAARRRRLLGITLRLPVYARDDRDGGVARRQA